MQADDTRSFFLSIVNKEKLIEKIRLSFENPEVPLWFPDLSPHLVKIGWENLAELGLDQSNYSTTRLITKNGDSPHTTFEVGDKINSILIELFPESLADAYEESEVTFYSKEELSDLPVLECLRESLELIKTIPSLWDSFSLLVKSIHLIKPENDEYDVSFSEPRIPFSIFVSIPKKRISGDTIRGAEGIVHEAMHLLLSLVERLSPLVTCNNKAFYSPWKREKRNSTGIVHALYVFKAISEFYRELESATDLEEKNTNFIHKRREDISRDIDELENLSELELTKEGFALVNRLYKKII
jgi:hypothetical protein